MNEIKFRGKRIDNGEWVEGVPVNCEDGTFILTDCYGYDERFGIGNRGEYKLLHRAYQVDPATVGQSTGIPDKNGREIYGGDRCNDGIDLMTVVFKNGCFLLVYDRTEIGRGYLFREANCIEVIGNINDNPESIESEGE